MFNKSKGKGVEKVDTSILEKSWNDAVESLNALLSDDDDKPEKNLGKSKDKGSYKKPLKKGKDKTEPTDDDFEEDEDEDEDGKKKDEDDEVKKSLEGHLSEDENAVAAMDVEPFLRQLVKGIDERFDALESALSNVKALTKAQAKLFAANAELQKSMFETVEKIGETPVETKGVFRKSGDRFVSDSGNGKDKVSRTSILEKALKLRRDGKLSDLDVTKIEGRLNKGLDLNEYEEVLNAEVK